MQHGIGIAMSKLSDIVIENILHLLEELIAADISVVIVRSV